MSDEEFTLDRYLEEAKRSSVILENEENLLQAARQGDQQAKQTLVTSYLSLTAELGLRLAKPSMRRLEAIQEANLVLIGLIEKAVDQPAANIGPAIKAHFASLS